MNKLTKESEFPKAIFWCPICNVEVDIVMRWRTGIIRIVCENCGSLVSDIDNLEDRKYNPTRRYTY